jgi:hypothetical protein
MPTAHELLKRAKNCYAQARASQNVETRRALVQMGDEYMKQAENLQQEQTFVHSAFPKPDSEIG